MEKTRVFHRILFNKNEMGKRNFFVASAKQPGRAGGRWTAPPRDGCPYGKKRVVGTPLPGCPNGPVGKNLRRGSAQKASPGGRELRAQKTRHVSGVFLQIVKKRPIQAKPIPSPGGKVAPEGGRKRNSGRNLKVCTTRRPTKRLDLKRYIQ